MAVITYTREAKCKDCDNFRYYYKRNRKAHWCIKHDTPVTLRDRSPSCFDTKDFIFRKEYYPKRLYNDTE